MGVPHNRTNTRVRVDEWLERIADFAAQLRYEDLPEATIEAARERLVDSVGCALGSLGNAGGCPPAEVGWRVANPPSLSRRAGYVIGTGDIFSAESAAFVNGCLIRYLD